MRLLLLLCFLSLNGIISAQQGFSKTVLLPDSKSCSFASVLVDQDTLVCWGTTYGTSENKWGVCLTKFDTSGNLLQVSTDFDSVDNQTVNPICQLLRTSDGGYLGVASQGVGNKTAAYKFSHTGELEWKHFYREPDFQVVITYSAQELADGYLCFGRYSVDYDNSNFTMKLSKSGEMLWFSKDIGVSGVNDATRGRAIKWGNNFMLGSGQGPISTNESWSKTVLLEVDSNGQVVWDWYGQIEAKETGVLALVTTPDSNIVIGVSRYFTNSLNGLSSKLKFRCIQPETGNTLWHTELPTLFDLSYSKSVISQIKASPIGEGFDAIGFHSNWYNGFVIQGILAHYDWNGNMLWQRYDTVHVDTVFVVSENKLYNMAHLSSGSIIGVGDIKRSDPYPHLEGWLIKWSSNGCLEENDCATVSTHDDLSGGNTGGWRNWEVYPNPASGYTWLYQPEGLSFRKGEVQILNVSGQVVRNQPFGNDFSGQYKIILDDLPHGLYFYQVVIDGEVQQAGRLIVM
jgi:Secretion system C-terminal sorting domain